MHTFVQVAELVYGDIAVRWSTAAPSGATTENSYKYNKLIYDSFIIKVYLKTSSFN